VARSNLKHAKRFDLPESFGMDSVAAAHRAAVRHPGNAPSSRRVSAASHLHLSNWNKPCC
jgi:hypothetical protein